MSLSGVTAFLSKNKIVGTTADIVRAMLSGAVSTAPTDSKSSKTPKKGASQDESSKGKGKKTDTVENPVKKATLVKSWTNPKGDDVIVIVGPSADSLKTFIEKLNESEGTGVTRTMNPDLKKAGYVGVVIPSTRKKAADAAISFFKKNKHPMVESLEEISADEPEAPKKNTKGNKKEQVDESDEAAEEDESSADEEDGEDDAEDTEEVSSEEDEPEPPKKGAKGKGGKGKKKVDSDDDE